MLPVFAKDRFLEIFSPDGKELYPFICLKTKGKK